MKKASIASCILLMLLVISSNTASAVPIISIDTNPGMAGIQNSLTVNSGDTFNVDVVLTGDGTSTFDTVILDLDFDSSVLMFLDPPLAGSLAGQSPTSAIDPFSGLSVVQGSALTSLYGPASGSLGGVGIISAGAPFDTIAAGATASILSLSFQAISVGSSTLQLSEIFGPILTLGGDAVDYTIEGASIRSEGNVSPVPEPSTMMLLASGLLVTAVMRRVQKGH
jgi:hypothetical protein